MRKSIRWSYFLFVIIFFANCLDCNALEDSELYAKSAVIMDAESGRVLYSKNGEEFMANASTTKIMTCILVLELGNLDDTAVASGYAASMPKVKMYAKKGEEYKVNDLLYSMMLESHNDSAVILAEYLGSKYLGEEFANRTPGEYSVEESKKAVMAFSELMNQKALEIGCSGTYFITPNGLDAHEGSEDNPKKFHGTCAVDLAKIMAYCVEQSPMKEKFIEITRTPSYSFCCGTKTISCSNHNLYLNMCNEAISGKTGFTNKAGYCYVAAVGNEEKNFTMSLLACGWPNNKNYKWSDMKKLTEYAMNNFEYRSFYDSDISYDEKALGYVTVLNGQTEDFFMDSRVSLELEEVDLDTSDGALMRSDEKIEVKSFLDRNLEAPVYKGQVVGKVEYLLDGEICREQNIILSEDVKRIDYMWWLKKILDTYFVNY